MRKGLIAKLGVGLALALPVVGIAGVKGTKVIARRTNWLDGEPIRVRVYDKNGENGRDLNVPLYNLDKVPPSHCSGCARRVAEDVFGVIHPREHAWNRRYIQETYEIKDGDFGRVRQGDIIGIYYENSSHLNGIDRAGKRVAYTHNGVFVGYNKNGKALIAHQFGRNFYIDTLKDLEDKGCRVREGIKPTGKRER